ncbi:HTH-type transcriptional activator Btr [compost metagenome]
MSYQLLLVDDEIHAIEGVKSDLDLERLNISKLITALNSRQAKEVFQCEQVDIMLCDIEMPQGNGLELLAWVREQFPNTVAIFLTAHADFKYAKEALQLGSLDYLQKPVLATELEAAIRKAQSLIDRNSELNQSSKFHQLWMKHHSLIIERFWQDLISHTIPSRWSAICEQAERQQIPITPESKFLPLLISVQKWKRELKRRDEKIMEYALRNSAEELIIGKNGSGICLPLATDKLLIILDTETTAIDVDEAVVSACQSYIDSCSRYFNCELSCYIGDPVKVQEMASIAAELTLRDRNNVAFMNRVFTLAAGEPQILLLEFPVLERLPHLLKSGSGENVILEVECFLDRLVQSGDINSDILHQFNQDFMQVLYSFLNIRGIQAHRLLGNRESREFAEAAGRTVDDMLIWTRHAVRKAMLQAEAVKENDTVVQTVKRHILLHLDEDLSREMLAEQVFLNPDYLSRIFKKETGYSISEYILFERISRAKELLAQTDVTISAIATSVGYTNFSHFAKIFKKYAGMGPTEYRTQFELGLNIMQNKD